MVPGVILEAAPAAGSNCVAQRSGTALDCMIHDTAKAVYNMSISNNYNIPHRHTGVARTMALF